MFCKKDKENKQKCGLYPWERKDNCEGCECIDGKEKPINSGYPLLAEVTAAEWDVVIDALQNYQLQIDGRDDLRVTAFAVKEMLRKLRRLF